jgi:prepilin-type N-terminal cleavage/methylation domain-containing protein
MMRTAKAQQGLTVVELLIVAAILGIVLAIATNYLITSWTLANQTTARNEMQMNLRAAMEMISTDLYNAGSSGVQFDCAPATVTPALTSTRPADRNHTLTVRYCDPYTANTPVVVTYALQQDPDNGNLMTLYRTRAPGNSEPAIPGIVGFELEFVCAPTPCTDNPTAVGFNTAQVRSVIIRLAAQSTRPARGVNSTYTFDNVTLTAVPGYYYEYAQQAVSPRSLGN